MKYEVEMIWISLVFDEFDTLSNERLKTLLNAMMEH
jgi:hypothetical protein